MKVVNFMDRNRNSVVREIESLLADAKLGNIIGIGYALVTENRSVQAGLAGLLAKDRLKAAGILLSAAARSAEDMAE